jgi:NRAMP (natural resistance-associated macrophage protein)-like metal ion transporter
MNKIFDYLKILKRRLLIFLVVLGPGIITAMADNDAGGVATYSIVGAKFGYSMLFLLLLITILLAITQEIGVRIAMVTAKGLGDLIREYYGIRISLFIFLLLFIANLGSTIANFAGLTAGFSLFHIPKIPFLIFFTILMILFVTKGNYRTNQRIFLGSAFLYIVYIFSAILAHPNWAEAIKNLLLPVGIQFHSDYIFTAIALLGTTITPWGQFFVHSYVIDKKLPINKLKYEQAEVFFGAFLTDFFSFFMIVAVAATLFTRGIMINNAAEAALAIKPFAGEFASALFAFGLINASYMGAVIIPLTTAYAFAEFFGVGGSLDAPLEKNKTFYFIFIFQILIAFLFVLIPQISLFNIVLYTQGLNGVLLPIVFYFLLKFANNKKIMNNYSNNKFNNVFAVVSSIVIFLASLYVIISGILGKL